MNKSEALTLWQDYKTREVTHDMMQDIEDEWHNRVIELYKELTGHKTKSFEIASNKLFYGEYADLLKEEIKPFHDRVSIFYDNFKAEKQAIEDQLKEFSKTYIPEHTEELNLLETVSGGSYHTQGFGANKYARESLNDDIQLLILLGYNTDVKTVDGHSSGGMYPVYHESYELWADITEFDFQMLQWSGEFISVLNWAVMCWQKNTNPKVYFPFLSDDDYQKSQVLAYKKHYKITKENMRLELSWNEINALP